MTELVRIFYFDVSCICYFIRFYDKFQKYLYSGAILTLKIRYNYYFYFVLCEFVYVYMYVCSFIYIWHIVSQPNLCYDRRKM